MTRSPSCASRALALACVCASACVEPSVGTTNDAPISLLLSARVVTLSVGESAQLVATVSTGSEPRLYLLRFSSRAPSVVVASAVGVLTAVAPGSAIVDVEATLVATGESSAASIEVSVSDTVSEPVPPSGTVLSVEAMGSDGGYAYAIYGAFGGEPDSLDALERSTLRLFEDGAELGPAHTWHAEIRSLGGGRFSHWMGSGVTSLHFSASDGSDPRTNGRVYTIVVDDVAPSADPPVLDGVAYTGVTAAMWNELDVQRAAFGDSNDCRARVAALPTSGALLAPCDGSCINTALDAHDVVLLQAGTYRLGGRVHIDAGQKLLGAPGAMVVLDAAAVDEAVIMTGDAVLANVQIAGPQDGGVNMGLGTNGALVYRVSVVGAGAGPTINSAGYGIGVFYDAVNDCVVSTEVRDGFNEDGQGCSACANGGNSDGYRLTYGAANNTLIDAHAYGNSDDGIDFWEGGHAFVYLSSSFANGKANGDGNGIKLGVGSAAHKFYKVTAHDNRAYGWVLNGQTVQPTLVSAGSYANGRGDYGGFSP